MNENRPTIRDVARVSGVSLATVSRVLNHSGAVRPQLRSQVEAAIQSLGYEYRRVLPEPEVQPQTDLLPILVPDVVNPYFMLIAQGIQGEIVENADLLSLIINTSGGIQRQRRVLKSLLALDVVGLIVCGTDVPLVEWQAFLDAVDYPIVFVHDRVEHPRATTIKVNFEDAASRITQHLLSLNHTRIAYIADFQNSEHSLARQRGIENLLARRKLSLLVENMPTNLPMQEGVNQVIGRFLTLPAQERPTAMIVYNDYIALHALNAVRSYGLRVPEDISIASFDNIPTAVHANPSLTTVDVPKSRMGRLAYQMLVQLKRGEIQGGGYTMIDTDLVVRESTGPVAPG